MTRVEAAARAFTILNALRLIACLPQIAAIWRDRHGATAISLSAWGLWAASHLSTAAYAYEATGDGLMVATMLVNAASCVGILALTLYKRRGLPGTALGRARALPSRRGPRTPAGARHRNTAEAEQAT